MGGNFFSKKSVAQTETQAQTAVQGGGAGSATTAFGQSSSGNAAFSAGALVGDTTITAANEAHVAITTNDPAAAIKALEVNQEVSTQAISYANINANTALQTLQQFGHELSTITSGNKVEQSPLPPVAPPTADEQHSSDIKFYVGVGITVFAIIVTLILYRKRS